MQAHALRSGFTVSQAGHLVYGSSNVAGDLEIIVTDRSGTQLSSLETTGIPSYVRISPDGHKVAVAELEPGGTTSIWIYDLGSRARSRFTFAGGIDTNPVWSPDGSQLALASSRTGTFGVYDERIQSWSSDGRYVVLDSRPQSRLGLPQITILPLTGDRKSLPYLNAPYINAGGQVSPDGRWLAYAANESGRMEVYVSSFPRAKGKWQVSSTGGQAPRWRKDGRELFYCRADGALMVAEVTPGKDSFVVGSAKQVSERRVFQTIYYAPYDVFPDGQRIIMPAVKPQSVHAPLTLVTNWIAELNK
jgi:Tol biopolymer transport system component